MDRVVMLNFTKEMSMMSAREFMERVLRNDLNVKVLVMGYDHRFGHDKDCAFDDYVRYGEDLGIEVVRGDEWCEGSGCTKFSSSEARRLLLDGDIETANNVLGYRYGFDGVVVGGFRVGRTIGFPTANVAVDSPVKLVPKCGVYAVVLSVLEGDGEGTYAGMMNIGYRPTLNNGKEQSIEVHALDFAGDIYSAKVRIEFVARLRDERRFGSVDELRIQLERDEAEVRRIMGNEQSCK
jgi:riboflavin kinase/FMN adenylyltransferase